MSNDERLREYAKRLLLKLMEDISEDHYCAGWMHNLEFDLWRIVQGGDPCYGMYPVEPEIIEQLKALSHDADGWFTWKDDSTFIAMSEWLPIYEEHVAFQKAKGYWK